MATATASTTTARESGAMFVRWLMPCRANIAPTIASLITLEVGEWSGATARHRTRVPVTRIVAVIDVPVEAMRTMEPRSRA